MSRYDYKVHPLADLFPMMSAEEFRKLKEDIKKNGQLEPIVVNERNEILDGRNRLWACRELGIEPNMINFEIEPKVTESDYIWSKNILRRHLTDDQRAAIGHKWSDTERQAARDRQRQNLRQGDTKPEVMDSSPRGKTREVLAKKAEVSTHKIQQVETVAKHAPELLPKVASGDLKLKDAVKQASPKRSRKPKRAVNYFLVGGNPVSKRSPELSESTRPGGKPFPTKTEIIAPGLPALSDDLQAAVAEAIEVDVQDLDFGAIARKHGIDPPSLLFDAWQLRVFRQRIAKLEAAPNKRIVDEESDGWEEFHQLIGRKDPTPEGDGLIIVSRKPVYEGLTKTPCDLIEGKKRKPFNMSLVVASSIADLSRRLRTVPDDQLEDFKKEMSERFNSWIRNL